MSDTTKDIESTRDGQCTAAVIVRGEHFWCDLGINHCGWAHGSSQVEAIWRGSGTEDGSEQSPAALLSPSTPQEKQ